MVPNGSRSPHTVGSGLQMSAQYRNYSRTFVEYGHPNSLGIYTFDKGRENVGFRFGRARREEHIVGVPVD